MFLKALLNKLNINILIKIFAGSRKTKSIAACFTVAFCFAVAVFAYSVNHTVAVAVICNGKTVGYVDGITGAAEVEAQVKAYVYGDCFGMMDFEYEDRFVNVDSISEASDVAVAALESVDGIEKHTALYTDGMLTAVAANETEMQAMIGAVIEIYTAGDMQFAGYANDVAIKDIYAVTGSTDHLASTEEEFRAGKSGIMVMTARVESYEEEVPYETEVTHDATKIRGYSYTVKDGKNGLSTVTANVTYINGDRSYADVISSEIITEPVNAKVVEGISDEAMAEVRRTMASFSEENNLMVFPCEITDKTYISSYWGDGRGHKGVDIASPYGSEIYASLSGTVSFAGYKWDYGYYIVIDHADGQTQTLYSHCSKMLVKAGDTVVAGQPIALVGATGNASGNHLHFSVMVNGCHVDPAPYIGLVK